MLRSLVHIRVTALEPGASDAAVRSAAEAPWGRAGGWCGGKGTGALPSHRSGSPGQAERGRAGPECPEALTQEAELTNGRWARIHHFGGP